MSSAIETLGRVGLPAPVVALASRPWDALVIGAGHNGLACAAYLARAGKRVLVLEARERVGGACTLEETWPGFRISPCAYVAGLLHPLVFEELDFRGHGFDWIPASAGLFVPFEDGTSVQLWDDEARCEEEIARFAPGDLEGFRRMKAVLHRACEAVRPVGPRDMWIGPAPRRDAIEERLRGDREAIGLLFEWSMAEYVERYLKDERLQMAYLGQGVIGTSASPRDPGTASIYFHHFSGRMAGPPGSWGYVRGGMGVVSFILCDIAREAGATVAAGLPVARVLPGEGVLLEGGERIAAPVVVSNADPRVLLRLLGDAADPGWRARVESIPMTGVTLKVNAVVTELPNFRARPGTMEPHHTGMINTPLTMDEWQDGFDRTRRGELPRRLWTELYFQTAHDPSVAPPGMHTMSVFAQYVPPTFASGSWDSRREEAGRLVLDSIARFSTNVPETVVQMEVLGPPDIEKKVGLTGGHIFQGEILPNYMWSNRLSPRTPMRGVFLCGAATHPGGSVIALNGRNAAMEILRPSTLA